VATDHTRISLPRRAFRLYQKQGLKSLLYAIPHRLAWGYLELLNNRKLPRSKDRYVLREILGSNMYLDLDDKGISRDLLVDGIRERENVEVVKRQLHEGDIVIDVGANIGYYVLLEAKLVGEKGRVFAIEPVPHNYDLLTRNMQANRCQMVEAFQFAVGDKPGYAPIQISTHRNLCSIRLVDGYSERGLVKQQVDVEVRTLDSFLSDKPYPKLIRMDIEGYESYAIKGLEKTLEAKLPLTIMLEFHFPFMKPEESLETLHRLKKANFEIVDIRRKQWMPGLSQHRLLERTILSCEDGGANLPMFGNLELTIDQVLENKQIMSGEWGGLEICFKRS